MRNIIHINEFFKINENNNIDLFKNESKLKDQLLKDDDFSKGDVHQALLNVFHNYWQSNKLSYTDFLAYVDNTYGYLSMFSILLAKYCYQVNNGGHAQYIYNGYASSNSRGCSGDYKDLDKHKIFIKLFKDLNLDIILPNGRKALNIISKLTRDSRKWDKLDDHWYDDINEDIMEDFNNYLKTLTLDGDKITNLIEFTNSSIKYNI